MSEDGARAGTHKHTHVYLFPRHEKLHIYVFQTYYLITEQDRQCTYDVTMRRVHETIVVVEEQLVLNISLCVRVCARANERVPGSVGVCMRVRACSCVYPACNSYAPYCDVICGPSGSNSFFDIIS